VYIAPPVYPTGKVDKLLRPRTDPRRTRPARPPSPSAARAAKPLAVAIAALAAALVAAGCGDSGGSSTKLSLVAYSTPKEAYAELIPAFRKTPEGEGVEFTQSYGASGDQSRSVAAGLPADVVAFSLQPDVDKLVEPGKVPRDWSAGPEKGFVTNSVVVFAVRKGNPKGIRTWDDLVEPGVEVLEPNPFTSGGARWNVMAAYGAQIAQGRSEQEAEKYLSDLFGNVVVQDKSAREALQTFESGKGDVLLAYENEAIAAKQKGLDVDYVIPDQTILIQNPIAVTASGRDKPAAKAFVDFLTSPEGQRIYASKGYRPVHASQLDPKAFPTPKALFRIDRFGGWSVVNDRFFDPDTGVVAGIEKEMGVSTGG
jgi:sulfate transport system substrate-binding protein